VRGGERVEYVEVTAADVALANKLAHEVLGRSLDELPPQTRRLLMLIEKMSAQACGQKNIERSDYRFSRREVRQYTGWSYEQIRVHLDRLVAMEYVLVHHGGRGQSFVYELLYDGAGKDGARFVMHLLDVTAAETSKNANTTQSLGGQKARFGVPYRAHTGPIPAPYRGGTGVTKIALSRIRAGRNRNQAQIRLKKHF
jgi:hypothetical protein